MTLSSRASASKNQKWDGSRITPVHQIPLKDEFNQPIVPTEKNPLPFSARYTCQPCHDYSVVRQGLHFNATLSPQAGRPGEPWIWVDERTGTLLPLSYHTGKGLWNPYDLGLTAWDFTLLFGRHMAGGGINEPDDKDITPESRWSVSGKVEINCLGCHNAARLQNLSEWVKQILRQNFRWAATAAAGLGEVGGMSSRLKGTWDIFDGPNPDDSEWAVAPSVRYSRELFDSKQRAYLDIAYKADDGRCLACHATAPSGAKKFAFDEDVHTAAGLKCVDCHRNDISHNMTRGYEGEAADNPALPAEDLTCRGCHLGGETVKAEKIPAGRLGAPFPRHKGIPAVHFERLSCTVCHSGPLPGKEPTRVRTSRANRLGIFGIANWTTDMPAVVEPVYVREKNKKLVPHRLMWPAFWGEVKGKTIAPLKPDRILAAAGDILFPEKSVTRILSALSNVPELAGTPVLIMEGKVYEMNVDGGLDSSPYAGATKSRGYFWTVKKDGKILPLIPDFDPTNKEAAGEFEAKIQKVLEALSAAESAPGKPVLVYKEFLYQIIENYVGKSERKNQPADAAAGAQFFWLKDGKALPLISEVERRTIAELAGAEETLSEEQVAAILKALAGKNPESRSGEAAKFVYISGGKMFCINNKGKLEAKNHEAAAPVTWPLAHRVRPARQSLGTNGCTDCHSAGSNFFFSRVRGRGPLKTGNIAALTVTSFMGLTKPYHFLFGLSFTLRPALKVVLFICAVVIGALLLIVFLIALGRLAGLIDKRR
jgi:hypothetical protein